MREENHRELSLRAREAVPSNLNGNVKLKAKCSTFTSPSFSVTLVQQIPPKIRCYSCCVRWRSFVLWTATIDCAVPVNFWFIRELFKSQILHLFEFIALKQVQVNPVLFLLSLSQGRVDTSPITLQKISSNRIRFLQCLVFFDSVLLLTRSSTKPK